MDRAEAAVDAELSQIHSLNSFVPKFAKDLSYEQKNKALESLLFVTEKRNGNIKGQNVVDGSKHRSYDGYEKSDGSSPTVMTDSVYLMGTITAFKGKAQGIMDVANAFLHANNDENVLMLLRGKLAELMVKVDPSMYR